MSKNNDDEIEESGDEEDQIAEWIKSTKNEIIQTFNDGNDINIHASEIEFSETYGSEPTLTAANETTTFDGDQLTKRQSFSYIRRYKETVAQELNAQKENEAIK